MFSITIACRFDYNVYKTMVITISLLCQLILFVYLSTQLFCPCILWLYKCYKRICHTNYNNNTFQLLMLGLFVDKHISVNLLTPIMILTGAVGVGLTMIDNPVGKLPLNILMLSIPVCFMAYQHFKK